MELIDVYHNLGYTLNAQHGDVMVSTGLCLVLTAVEWLRNNQPKINWKQKFSFRCLIDDIVYSVSNLACH